jgi:hypothetical protein
MYVCMYVSRDVRCVRLIGSSVLRRAASCCGL